MDKLFGINGLAGLLLIVVVLLGIAACLATRALSIQQVQATNYYKIENPSNIPQEVKDASMYYKNVKE